MENNNIEIREYNIQAILTKTPHVIIRYGITIMCIIMTICLIGSFVFKYPDIIYGQIKIVTEKPSVWLVARTTGRIKNVYCEDMQYVKKNDLIAEIENSADLRDVLLLDSLLTNFVISDTFYDNSSLYFENSWSLGDVQSFFSAFIKAINNYDNFFLRNTIIQEKIILQKQIDDYELLFENLEKQHRLREKDLQISDTAYNREKSLFDKGIISKAEFESVEQEYLGTFDGLLQINGSIISRKIELSQLEEEYKKLTLLYLQEKMQVYTDLEVAFKELLIAIETWKQKYLFISPISGHITSNLITQENKFVSLGDEVFSILEEESGILLGKVQIESNGHGKVKYNQIVNVKLDGYPYMEYGIIKARVRNRSHMLVNDYYTIEVDFPDNLQTSMHKIIPFEGELMGTAEIITNDRSLGERFTSPLMYVFKEHFEIK